MNKKIDLLFGTGNPNKVEELREQLPSHIRILDMNTADINQELEENRSTIAGNSLQKVEQLIQLYDGNSFAEDTGLCVPSLGGAPGVHSARYAGPQKSDKDNVDKLLRELAGRDRKAYFLTVITLYWNGKIYSFEGRCNGTILYSRRGEKGFGYDPIFQPSGFRQSFAEMDLVDKIQISHRGKAVGKLIYFLQKNS